MKLIFVNPNPMPSPDPESLQVIQNAVALSKNAEIHLIVRRGLNISIDEYYNVRVPQNLRVYFLRGFKMNKGPVKSSWNLPFFLLSLFRIVQLNRVHKINAVLVRNLKMSHFLLRWRACLKFLPIIFETHEIFTLSFLDEIKRKGGRSGIKAKRLEERERYVYGNVSGLICITEHLSRMIQERFRTKGKVLVAHDGVDLSNFPDLNDKTPPNQANTSLKTLLYIGSLHHWKGVDVLLESIQYLKGINLMIVGGGDDSIRHYKEFASTLKVNSSVHFEGFVSPGKRFKYFDDAHICILPLKSISISRYFTSPLKLFEYMASGKPIVASDLPSIREVIRDNVNGILVAPDNPKALADGINRLLENPQLGTRLAAQARDDIEAFTWDKRAEKINNFIRSNWMNTCVE